MHLITFFLLIACTSISSGYTEGPALFAPALPPASTTTSLSHAFSLYYHGLESCLLNGIPSDLTSLSTLIPSHVSVTEQIDNYHSVFHHVQLEIVMYRYPKAKIDLVPSMARRAIVHEYQELSRYFIHEADKFSHFFTSYIKGDRTYGHDVSVPDLLEQAYVKMAFGLYYAKRVHDMMQGAMEQV